MAPTLSLTGRPADPSSGADVAFDFTADEPATYECSLEGPKPSAAAACASGISYSGLPNGAYAFTVVATDLAGNVGDPLTARWKVDNSIGEPPPAPPPPVDRTPPQTLVAHACLSSSGPAATVGAAP